MHGERRLCSMHAHWAGSDGRAFFPTGARPLRDAGSDPQAGSRFFSLTTTQIPMLTRPVDDSFAALPSRVPFQWTGDPKMTMEEGSGRGPAVGTVKRCNSALMLGLRCLPACEPNTGWSVSAETSRQECPRYPFCPGMLGRGRNQSFSQRISDRLS